MSNFSLRHHCMSLRGVSPDQVRVAELSFYADGALPTDRVPLSGPVAKPERVERIVVTADQCHNGDCWSLFMLGEHVASLGVGKCMVRFADAG